MQRSALVLAFLLFSPLPAAAQKSTERFIPIGRSPGLSGALTTVARIEGLDPGTGTLALVGAAPVVVSERTRIWIDRSATGQTNLSGNRSDLQPGRLVEVSTSDPERRVADWIKVRPQ